jgi:hypothetical protein
VGLYIVAAPTLDPVSVAEMQRHSRVDSSLEALDLLGWIAAATRHVEADTDLQLAAAQYKLTLDGFPPSKSAWLRMMEGYGYGYVYGYSRIRQYAGSAFWQTVLSGPIELPKSPLLSVDSIAYTDANQAPQTLDPSLYQVQLDYEHPVIWPAFNQSWPTVLTIPEVTQITFTVGFAVTTVATPVTAGSQAVTPASMKGILVGRRLLIDQDNAAAEFVVVTAVTGTTFTAVFANAHAGPFGVNGVPTTLRQAIRLLAAHWYTNREAVMPNAGTPVAMAYESLINTERVWKLE